MFYHAKKIDFLICSIGFFAIIFLLIKNFPLSGETNFNINFEKDSGLSGRLGPKERIDLQNNRLLVFSGPIYFDARIMPWHNFATVMIEGCADYLKINSIGVQTAAGWNYEVKEPRVVSDEGGCFSASVDFDQSNFFRRKNFVRFIIGFDQPDDDISAATEIKSIKIKLKR